MGRGSRPNSRGLRTANPMADEYSVFGQLSQMNPSGSTRNSKEVPVDRDARRRLRGKKKEPEKEKAEEERLDLQEGTESSEEAPPVGKVLDITI